MDEKGCIVVVLADWRALVWANGSMFALVRQWQSLLLDENNHFEGYTRADGETFNGG